MSKNTKRKYLTKGALKELEEPLLGEKNEDETSSSKSAVKPKKSDGYEKLDDKEDTDSVEKESFPKVAITNTLEALFINSFDTNTGVLKLTAKMSEIWKKLDRTSAEEETRKALLLMTGSFSIKEIFIGSDFNLSYVPESLTMLNGLEKLQIRFNPNIQDIRTSAKKVILTGSAIEPLTSLTAVEALDAEYVALVAMTKTMPFEKSFPSLKLIRVSDTGCDIKVPHDNVKDLEKEVIQYVKKEVPTTSPSFVSVETKNQQKTIT